MNLLPGCGKAAGATVLSVGLCVAGWAQTPAAVAGPGRHHHRHPPQQAIIACDGRTAGADCSFTDRDGVAITGHCMAHTEAAPSERDTRLDTIAGLFCKGP